MRRITVKFAQVPMIQAGFHAYTGHPTFLISAYTGHPTFLNLRIYRDTPTSSRTSKLKNK